MLFCDSYLKYANRNSHIASLSILFVQSGKLLFYQIFINFTNSLGGKYVNQFWIFHKKFDMRFQF